MVGNCKTKTRVVLGLGVSPKGDATRTIPLLSACGKLVKLVLTCRCWLCLSEGHRRREGGSIPSLPTHCPIAQWQSDRLLSERL